MPLVTKIWPLCVVVRELKSLECNFRVPDDDAHMKYLSMIVYEKLLYFPAAEQ